VGVPKKPGFFGYVPGCLNPETPSRYRYTTVQMQASKIHISRTEAGDDDNFDYKWNIAGDWLR